MPSVEQVSACGVVPVVVLDDAERAVTTAKALLGGGINAMEIAFRTAAKASIARVAKEMPEMSENKQKKTLFKREHMMRSISLVSIVVLAIAFNIH